MYFCDRCLSEFSSKSEYNSHLRKKQMCPNRRHLTTDIVEKPDYTQSLISPPRLTLKQLQSYCDKLQIPNIRHLTKQELIDYFRIS